MKAKSLPNIDLAKGSLILLVILGHILLGSTTDNPIRWFIYEFHMPLFIGISGYLINTDKLSSFSFSELFLKYKNRVLIPWIVAVFGFAVARTYIINMGWYITFESLLSNYLYPLDHLWFIPAFLSWVVLTWILLKLKLRIKLIWIVSLVLSLFYFAIRLGLIDDSGLGLSILNSNQSTFRTYFYVFFVSGIVIRSIDLTKISSLLIIIPVSLFVLRYYLIGTPYKWISAVAYYTLNVSLIFSVLVLSFKGRLPRNNFIEWVGKASLAIYLWHMIPIVFAKKVFDLNDPTYYYLFSFASSIVCLLLIKWLSKVKWIDRYVFGIS